MTFPGAIIKGGGMNTGLEVLKSLAMEHNRKRFPSLPDHARAIHKYSDSDANSLTRAIVDFIKFNGGCAWRISSTGTYRNGIGWTKSNTQKGIADIHACMQGNHLSIEVKFSKSDRLSEDQKRCREEVQHAGGQYFVAQTFQGFYEWFTELPFIQAKANTTNKEKAR